MTYNVVIEGQTIPVPDEIGADDKAVKAALAPFYPEISNALITRVEKDGTTTITVVKKAGSKGTGLDDLQACTGGKNPAVALYEEIRDMAERYPSDPVQLLALDARLGAAIQKGQEQARAVNHALERLSKTTPRPAPDVVVGF